MQSRMSVRSSWDEYFMEIARQVASRATCDRKHVGALLVRDRIILSTGYNGSIRGMPHCDEVGHLMENGHCVATVHAEANAVLRAPLDSVNDITCAEALRRQLKWIGPMGEVVIWIDYTTTSGGNPCPTLHVSTRDQLPAITLPMVP